jgi:hypothetical protein
MGGGGGGVVCGGEGALSCWMASELCVDSIIGTRQERGFALLFVIIFSRHYSIIPFFSFKLFLQRRRRVRLGLGMLIRQHQYCSSVP